MLSASVEFDNRAESGLRGWWSAIAHWLTRLVPHDLLALGTRFGIGAIFFYSGRTKVDGFLTVTDGAISLFETEYKVPLIPHEIAAHMSAYAEHLFPLLLVLGLFTRLSALAQLLKAAASSQGA